MNALASAHDAARPDDRHVYCTRASARRLRPPQSESIHGPVSRRADRQDSGAMLLAERGYDADWIRAYAATRGAWANIPPLRNRTEPICFSPYFYRARNLVERFFNTIKHYRRVATRYDRLAATTSPSSSLRRLRYGCASMSLRPSASAGRFRTATASSSGIPPSDNSASREMALQQWWLYCEKCSHASAIALAAVVIR